jgi:Fe-Mn family superoxide dismutase
MNPDVFLSRRDVIKTLGAGAALLGLGLIPSRVAAAGEGAAAASAPQPFVLPKLGYAYDALEPHLDARTMEIHHTKHHQAYIANANKALADYPELQRLTAEEILRTLPAMPEKIRLTLRNNVGGHANHSFFWPLLAPQAGAAAEAQELKAAIGRTFGSLDAFQAKFTSTALGCFGSGWAWLCVKDGGLAIRATANQDSPLSEGAVPVLGLDVWEHAYYLHYQNRRADYVAAFWQVLNWPRAERNFSRATEA